MTPQITLYGHPESGHACKVALALSLFGIGHHVHRIDIGAPRGSRPAGFLDLSPSGEVPVLTIDDRPIRQSGAILIELATRFQHLFRALPEDISRGREIILREANRIGMCLPQLKASRAPGGTPLPPDVVAWLEDRFATDRDRFDMLLGAEPFLHGRTPGIGDCAVWGYVQWLDAAGLAPSPAMAGWRRRMRALPGMVTPEQAFPA